MQLVDITTVLLGYGALLGHALYTVAGVTAAAGASWLLVKLRYRRIEASLHTRLERAEEVRCSFDRTFPGRTPTEVAARVQCLENQLASLPPRRLTDAQKQTIVSAALPPSAASRLAIVHDSSSAEVRRYARDFEEAFSKAPGWNLVIGRYPMPPESSSVGVALGLGDPENPTAVERIVQQALRNARVEYDSLPLTTPGADVEIIVKRAA